MTRAWPFLISSGKEYGQGYELVVVPDFAIDSKVRREILRAAGRFRTDENQAICYHGQHPDGSPLILIFRVVPATTEMLGQEPPEPLTDFTRTRTFYFFEGLVLREDPPALTITQAHMDEVRRRVQPHFQHFWETSSRIWSPRPEGKLHLTFAERDIPIHLSHTGKEDTYEKDPTDARSHTSGDDPDRVVGHRGISSTDRSGCSRSTVTVLLLGLASLCLLVLGVGKHRNQ
jgi:hypothetical protein